MSKVLLGDVAVEHKETCKGSKDGYPIVGLEHLIPEEITLTAWNEGSENTFSKMFRKGNVLFGRRRAYLKKAAVAPFDGICSGDITVIEAKPDRILPELLPFIIQNDDLFEFAVGKSAGSLSPRVKWEHLKNYEFELPDMEKQKELAELFWAMDNTKKSYQKLIAATDELVKSQFMEQFGNLDSNTKHYPIKKLSEIADYWNAITIYLQHQSEVTYSDFVRRIRIVNNLIQNSEDEVSDRQDRNRIPAILQAVDAIILTGVIDDSIEINFNVNQIQEEKEKIEFLMQNPDRTDEVFELEDHNMLKGQIGIIGLDNLSLGSRFSSLFTCSWDKIDCALMALGNYGQQERNKWRYQFASKSLQYAWDELFHKSANAGFENTHTILVELLKSKESFDDGILDRIISAFLAQCEKDNLYPWNYYYVKYPVFRPGSYGKMSNDDVVNKPYMFSVMQTKTQWSQNTYMPYLKEADDDHLSRDEMGQYLVYDDVYIVCENNSYGVYRNDDDSLTDTVTISQNEAGIDTEDRIIKLKKYIANMK